MWCCVVCSVFGECRAWSDFIITIAKSKIGFGLATEIDDLLYYKCDEIDVKKPL